LCLIGLHSVLVLSYVLYVALALKLHAKCRNRT
jgi:hypothetical protein